MKLAVAAAAVALAASPADYVTAHQQPDGGFAEPGARSDPALTSWAVLGLVAGGRTPDPSASDYLTSHPASGASGLALRILALRALRKDASAEVAGLEQLRRPDGRIGSLVNSTIWGVLALRAAGKPTGSSIRYLLRAQHRTGGWAWYPRGAPDSNDTAAAVEALCAAGVSRSSRPVRRALVFLRSLQRKDGGFVLVEGRRSDAQSTAWAIQAFVAAGRPPGRAAFRFLGRMRRPEGSYRYSKAYAAAPVWVTSQVLPALARRSFPLR
jgi:squalene-hopene cyclase-like protein/prenyltransferase/squalene oxidase-like repeat protein